MVFSVIIINYLSGAGIDAVVIIVLLLPTIYRKKTMQRAKLSSFPPGDASIKYDIYH